MWEYLSMPLLVGGIALLLVVVIVVLWSSRHKEFVNSAKEIYSGMSRSEVISIMGEPTSKEYIGDEEILIWEKSQWKGIQNGGTVTRAVKVVLVDDIVVSVSNKNLDKSTFW